MTTFRDWMLEEVPVSRISLIRLAAAVGAWLTLGAWFWFFFLVWLYLTGWTVVEWVAERRARRGHQREGMR